MSEAEAVEVTEKKGGGGNGRTDGRMRFILGTQKFGLVIFTHGAVRVPVPKTNAMAWASMP